MNSPATASPRVLIVTPEVTYLPDRMGSLANHLTAKAGGLADVSAALIRSLFEQGVDVHVALPDYRAIFHGRLAPFLEKEIQSISRVMPDERIHLAKDRAFFYLNRVYSAHGNENTKLALAFQREVLNNIIPRVQPDMIHCNDWMTGLIPAMARQMGTPCLFTIHNIHTVHASLAHIEDRGIDAAFFWQHLYFKEMANGYEAAREINSVDFLTSGVFAAHFVNTVSATFLEEMVAGRHPFVPYALQQELAQKAAAHCAVGILNAPDPVFDPETDPHLPQNYTRHSVTPGKAVNKQYLQKMLGLITDEKAPLFFWPSRLDPIQKGCQLLAEVLYGMISTWWSEHLQIVFVADGEYQPVFKAIVNQHGFQDRVAVCDFDEHLEHLGYAASDFMLIPSAFEPCGLPQMIAPKYGSLPIAYDTGGLHDTIEHIDREQNSGNGFLFTTHDTSGLFWAVKEAMSFYHQTAEKRKTLLQRVMDESVRRFNYDVTASHYVSLYEKMLERPLIPR